jgi:hypothetical protein
MATHHAAETITRPAEARSVWSKVFSGGNGDFAVVKLRLEPLPGANTTLFSSALDFPIS